MARQIAMDFERFFVGLAGLFHAVFFAGQVCQIVQRIRHVGAVHSRVLTRQIAPDFKRFFVGLAGLFHAVFVAVQGAQIVQRIRHGGAVDRGIATGELARNSFGLGVEHDGIFEVIQGLAKIGELKIRVKVVWSRVDCGTVGFLCVCELKLRSKQLPAQAVSLAGCTQLAVRSRLSLLGSLGHGV